MPQFKKLVTQSGADTGTAQIWETGITADSKIGYSIASLDAYWIDGSPVAAGDWKIAAIVNTTGVGTTTPASDDEILRVEWGLQNTGGVAVAVPYEPRKSFDLREPRITVQPEVYLSVESNSTSQANDVVFVITYEIVKLTDLELLRLLAGGA